MRGTAFRNCKWNPIQWFWSNSSWCNQWLALRENFNEIQGCFFSIYILTWTFKHFQSLALHCWNNIVRACTLSARILCVKIWRGYKGLLFRLCCSVWQYLCWEHSQVMWNGQKFFYPYWFKIFSLSAY